MVCALLLAYGLTQRNECKQLRADCSKLQEERVEREKEIGDTIVPLLTRTADLLLTVTGRASESTPSGGTIDRELLSAVRQLEATVKGLDVKRE